MNRSRSPITVLDPSGLSRRKFLVIGGGSLAAVLTGCGGGQGAPGSSEEEGVGGFSGGEYEGAALTLAYWNGFTGGDGPAMQALVKDFQAEHELISIKNNTVDWPTFYQQLPAATQAGKGPDVGVMHLDQLPTNAVSNVIVPVDDLAESLGLEEDQFAPAGLGGERLRGRALRHPTRRAHDRDVLQPGPLRQGGHHRAAHGCGKLR
jgi:multiple sugar transport system substrate-binding protein